MIDRTALLEDLKRLVTRVEADLLVRSEDADVPEIAEVLRGEYERARAAKRTADTYGEWREDRITQAAVAWVLSCVFVRFLEDNDLISPPRVAGPGERLRQARDAHQHYFLSHPRDTDREYLLSIFDELAASPGTSGIFGPHNALREIPNWLSGDKVREVIQFFQKIDANTGLLVHDFTDPAWDTRFLGDLYQDLSAYARSRYALLQTPHFVEKFLLDRTLEPAIDEFGLTDSFKMIDPACGSGHLVLGSFERILDRWQRSEPATPVRELVGRTLGSVYGVDINPFAVAIARFRLLLVAMRACGINRLVDAPDFRLNLECGDSLLHVPLIGGQAQLFDKHDDADDEKPKQSFANKAKPGDQECDHAYASENLAALKALLRYSQYHAVMANPPYITPKDPGLRDRYRQRFTTCHMKYSLAVPFMEHVFALCVSGGYTGQLTTNSFMKREFGKPLVETFFPRIDLTHVIDCSGAYIPGNGTPSAIIFGRNRPPMSESVRAVMGIRGEPTTPQDPASGRVWMAIVSQVDRIGSQSEFVSVADAPRTTFHSHPWSLGGGGAAELKQQLDATCSGRLSEVVESIGPPCFAGVDDMFFSDCMTLRRHGLSHNRIRRLINGDVLRDWTVARDIDCVVPYDEHEILIPFDFTSRWGRYVWRTRAASETMVSFGGRTRRDLGEKWWSWYRWIPERLRAQYAIPFAFVASHNHFALVERGVVFKQSAPVVILPSSASHRDHLALVGYLNSSISCFYLKQISHQKQLVGGDGVRVESRSVVPYEFAATKVLNVPFPPNWSESSKERLAEITTALIACVEELDKQDANVVVRAGDFTAQTLKARWAAAQSRRSELRARMIQLQEELDYLSYRMWDLVSDDVLATETTLFVDDIEAGCRPFEIVAGVNDDGFTVYETVPETWPPSLRTLWLRRIEEIRQNPSLRIIEDAHFKRRWKGRQGLFNHTANQDPLISAIVNFLLDRLERLCDFDGRMNDTGKPTTVLPIGVVSIGGLADAASHDPLFMEAAEVFVGAAGFDVTALVGQLVEKASVPFLPVLRYKATGLRKHEEWKEVWELQRKEDAIDARTSLPSDDRNRLTTEQAADLKRREVGDIPVPPKYASADFASSTYWSLRGKLDVPKERFVSFPFVTGADGQTMIAWAGLDHLQLAKAIGDFYGLVQNDIGGSDDPRLVPLLVAIHELIPWIRQWHAGNDPVYGGEPADFFEDFLRTEAAGRGMTVAEVIAWQPPARTRAKRAAKKAAKRATKKKPSETEEDAP